MKFSHRPKRRFWVQPFLLIVAILSGASIGLPLRADPASLIQTLMIVDQGNFFSFQWSFYFVDFPNRFALKEDPSKTIILNNPSTLYENVSEIVAVAFDLTIDGKPVRPEKISRLTISPNKICTVTMIYRGRPGGHLELRAPVLQYLPAGSIINYEILTLGHSTNVITGNLTGQKGPFTQAIVYQEINSSDQPMPAIESAAYALFKFELKTAWINFNWLLIVLIFFLILDFKKAMIPLIIMTSGWMVICLLYVAGIVKFPWILSQLIVCLPTILLGALAARGSQLSFWLGFVGCGAGFLNACYDLQQIHWTAEDQTLSVFAGLSLGFLCSISSASLVLLVLLIECKKYHEFETKWAPKICWFVAALALLLPLQKILFR